MKYLLEPTPHEEAIDFIASKPVVSREVFQELLPELKARAFTISGVTAFDVLQRVRDEVATVPAGARWDDAKKKIVEEIQPFLADPEDPDNTEAAERRAETILRTHGFQAYQAANYRNIAAQPGVFPYVMYQSMDDDRVRPAHAALEGMVFPFDSEFVQSHWCPWDWGCRCHWTPISEDDAREVREADAKAPPEARNVIEGRDLEHLQTTRSLVRGVNEIYDLRTPKEKGDPGAFTWNPRDLRIPVEKLKERYDSTVWAAFEKWAMGTPITSTKLSVWDWMTGKEISVHKPDLGETPQITTSVPFLVPPPRKSPASQAFHLLISGPDAVNVRRALAAIDFVHDDGALPVIPLESAPRLRSAVGEYIMRGSRAISIRLKPVPGSAFNLLEEIGHFLDHQALGTDGFGFASAKSSDFAAWRKAAMPKKRLRELSKVSKLRTSMRDVARTHEIFARSYSQYIATKSADPVLLSGLRADRGSLFGSTLYWSDEEFRPILKAMDDLFHKKGWL